MKEQIKIIMNSILVNYLRRTEVIGVWAITDDDLNNFIDKCAEELRNEFIVN